MAIEFMKLAKRFDPRQIALQCGRHFEGRPANVAQALVEAIRTHGASIKTLMTRVKFGAQILGQINSPHPLV